MCSFDSEAERHKAVLRDKPQPRFDTRWDWVNSNHRDAHHAEWAKAVAAAERRNHARKVREAKAKIRAAHDELAKLRASAAPKPGPVTGPDGKAWTIDDRGVARRAMQIGDRVVHVSPAPSAAPRRGRIVDVVPGIGPFGCIARVAFDDLPGGPVYLPATSLRLIA